MNNRDNAINVIEDFLKGNEKTILVKGTHQYEKHKLVMALLNKYYKNAKILFRTNGMDNLTNKDFIGFAGLKKVPKAGELVKIENNYYSFDSLNKRTWSKSNYLYDFIILYPLDSALRGNVDEVTNNIFSKIGENGKVFLISWTDSENINKEKIMNICDRNLTYDAEEENEAYHRRVLESMKR